jgi:hypothetical protein
MTPRRFPRKRERKRDGDYLDLLEKVVSCHARHAVVCDDEVHVHLDILLREQNQKSIRNHSPEQEHCRDAHD